MDTNIQKNEDAQEKNVDEEGNRQHTNNEAEQRSRFDSCGKSDSFESCENHLVSYKDDVVSIEEGFSWTLATTSDQGSSSNTKASELDDFTSGAPSDLSLNDENQSCIGSGKMAMMKKIHFAEILRKHKLAAMITCLST